MDEGRGEAKAAAEGAEVVEAKVEIETKAPATEAAGGQSAADGQEGEEQGGDAGQVDGDLHQGVQKEEDGSGRRVGLCR